MPEWSSDIQVIQGILSNAEEETTGDLPGELLITTEEEITLSFPFYITSESYKQMAKRSLDIMIKGHLIASFLWKSKNNPKSSIGT